ncbi:MAG: hypothetical protein ACLFUJ_13995 [Phycisphaerae bacterium]
MGVDAVGSAVNTIAAASQAKGQNQVAMAANIQMQKVSMDISRMAGGLIEMSLAKMQEMGATMSTLA